jgi:AGZA family xanthine/uracil permease-like MFS transporter
MRIFVRRDLDGFFGLFVDNLVQLLLIVTLGGALCGMQGEHAYLLYGRILPGAAISILVGNLFYGWQAHRLARRTGRDDVTALPYGINTPSLLVYVFFVIAPVYRETGDPVVAWKMGLIACLGSGLIEFLGAFVAEWARKHTPRAALLSTLAGIAIGFIAMAFALQIWTKPVLAMVPMAVVLVTYFAHARFPGGLPGGLVAILLGTAIAWLLPGSWTGANVHAETVRQSAEQLGWSWPVWCGGDVWAVLSGDWRQWVRFISVIIPMGLFNVIGSLQNIESAEAAEPRGDSYSTCSSLAVNGLGTILAALLGSCFPTTIYIGHPGWKGLGARAGYSSLNGLVITLMCLGGAVALVSSIIPIEAGVAIVLWIGIVITAQAFQATSRKHAPAVAVGLFPALAAWGATVVFGAFIAARGNPADPNDALTMQAVLAQDPLSEMNGFLLKGMIVLERGYIFTCMIVSAMAALLIDRRYFAAAVWSGIGALLTLLGLSHAFQISGNSVDYLLAFSPVAESALAFREYPLAAGYLAMAVVFVLLGLYGKARRNGEAGETAEVAAPDSGGVDEGSGDAPGIDRASGSEEDWG